jgi:2-C-methyl-D-erythritol 4-phosphate cytidylyltransferase
MNVAAIIVAGGKGKRFGGGVPKQFLNLSGKPVFMHSVENFKHFAKQIILVVPKGYENKYKGVTVVTGGKERYNSVQNALKVLDKDIDIVAVHDAARPLTLKTDIIKVCKAAEKYGASLLASPATDSIKFTLNGKFVNKSIPRSQIYMAQTPQAFRKEIILKAYSKLLKGAVTDDVQLVERLVGKIKIKIVVPSSENFKITAAHDFERAKIILKGRQ